LSEVDSDPDPEHWFLERTRFFNALFCRRAGGKARFIEQRQVPPFALLGILRRSESVVWSNNAKGGSSYSVAPRRTERPIDAVFSVRFIWIDF
jgi:hypothetical protein